MTLQELETLALQTALKAYGYKSIKEVVDHRFFKNLSGFILKALRQVQDDTKAQTEKICGLIMKVSIDEARILGEKEGAYRANSLPPISGGLTKLEWMASQLMAGHKFTAKEAVNVAKSLMEELDRERSKGEP
jgi:Arc/MetJ-type ribon-helix-helix transcriptional regulator